MRAMKAAFKLFATGLVILVAVAVVSYKYWDYVINPWTRDGQVNAQVIQITPRVSGPIINLPIRDNQFVRAGDLLLEIDPRTFQANLEQAQGELDSVRDQVLALEKAVEAARHAVEVARSSVEQAALEVKVFEAAMVDTAAEVERQKKLLPQGATSRQLLERATAAYQINVEKKKQAQSSVLQAKSALSQAEANLANAKAALGQVGEDNAQVRTAKAKVKQATLDLEFTQIKAPVDGYVTNLNLRLGSQTVANQAALALVDVNSFWIVGFFRETFIAKIRPGDEAVITLMSYPHSPILGQVDSIGWGIAQNDGSTSEKLLPSISPTFEWIRLAQRVPVRIHLTEVPKGIELRVGTTASVLVRTRRKGEALVSAPAALQ